MGSVAALSFARTRDGVARHRGGRYRFSRSFAKSKWADFTHLHELWKTSLDRILVAQVQKVLICHASVGSGHSRAAQASDGC